MAEKESPKNLLHLSGYPKGQGLIPECEVVYEGESHNVNLAYENCKKKSMHGKYIPVKDFDLHHLPEHLRTPRIKRLIELRCALTVRIKVTYTSEHRPNTYADSETPYPDSDVKGSKRIIRYGTGIIQLLLGNRLESKNIQCPCLACRDSKDPNGLKVSWSLNVITSTHVIYDKDEALQSQFDCFFDSEDGEGMKTFFGVGFQQADTSPDFNYKSDLCKVACAVHDEEIMKMLWNAFGSNLDVLFNRLTFPPEEVIVSHPHGGSKQISVGKIRYVTVPLQPAYRTNVPFPFTEKNIACCLPHDDTIDWGKNCMDLWITPQVFRKLFSTTGKSWVTEPIHETEIATEVIDKCLTAFFSCSFSKVRLKVIKGRSPRKVYDTINFLITQRLYNKKHPELLDLGLLLLWSYSKCLVDYDKNFATIDSDPDFDRQLTKSLFGLFFIPTVKDRPYLFDIFDIKGYLIETSGDVFQWRQHLSYREMQMTMIEILTGNDAVWVYDEKFEVCDNLIFLVQTFIHYSRTDDVLERLKVAKKPGDVDYLQPGKVSQLPGSDMTFTLPSTAKYAYRVYGGDHPVVVFPPGTAFHLLWREGIKLKLPIPDKTTFTISLSEPNLIYYVNYNTATCNGSSGAAVYLEWSTLSNSISHVHSTGHTTHKTKNHNRSGLTFQHGGSQDTKGFMEDFFEQTVT